MSNAFLHVGLNLDNKRILIVGAGTIALRKLKKLLNYSNNITVVSNEFDEEFEYINITKKKKDFDNSDLNNIDIVFICTDNVSLNEEIAKCCQEKNILYNNATSRNEMDFKMLATLEYDGYTISLSKDQNLKETTKFKKELEELLNKYKI
ncbi:MAG: bifunctional precorrin-2 dehydrogenase/sirohydrochlorin ferrochelatase [Erysipelotrichales bacterium]